MQLKPWLLSLAFSLALLHRGHPCAVLDGEGNRSGLESEEVALIWEAGTHREHFIRQASFHTDAKRLGFLVPTPTQPQLSAEKEELFADLFQVSLVPDRSLSRDGIRTSATPAAAVEVLHEQKVAGYEAAVLRAGDARALRSWLKAHGFQSDPQLESWLKPYLEKKFVITAFKVATGAGAAQLQPVRLSFSSQRPYFPYRQPAAPGHSLRLYFLSDQRYRGRLEDGSLWEGHTAYSQPFSGSRHLPAGCRPTWLTTMVHDLRRTGGDLYFEPSSEGPYPAKSEPFGTRDLLAAGACAVFGLLLLRWRLPRARTARR